MQATPTKNSNSGDDSDPGDDFVMVSDGSKSSKDGSEDLDGQDEKDYALWSSELAPVSQQPSLQEESVFVEGSRLSAIKGTICEQIERIVKSNTDAMSKMEQWQSGRVPQDQTIEAHQAVLDIQNLIATGVKESIQGTEDWNEEEIEELKTRLDNIDEASRYARVQGTKHMYLCSKQSRETLEREETSVSG